MQIKNDYLISISPWPVLYELDMIYNKSCLFTNKSTLEPKVWIFIFYFGVSKNSGQNMEALINRSRAEY